MELRQQEDEVHSIKEFQRLTFYQIEIDKLNDQLTTKCNELENLKNQLNMDGSEYTSGHKFPKEPEVKILALQSCDSSTITLEPREENIPREKGETSEQGNLLMEMKYDRLQSQLKEKNEEINHLNNLVAEAEDVLIEKEKEISWLNESIFEMKHSYEVSKPRLEMPNAAKFKFDF